MRLFLKLADLPSNREARLWRQARQSLRSRRFWGGLAQAVQRLPAVLSAEGRAFDLDVLPYSGGMDWTNEERAALGELDEMRIAGRRADGTLRKPVIIWVVPYSGSFYVRSVAGREAGWFRGTQECLEGHIWVGELERDVAFREPPAEIADRLDEVYRAKYRSYARNIVDGIVAPQARAAALELLPL